MTLIRTVGRWLKWAILSMVLLLALLLAWLLTTSSGLRTVLNEAAPYLPGELHIERVEGRLIGPFTLYGVRYQQDDMQAIFASAMLDWQPGALFDNTVHITQLRLNNSTISLAAPKAKPDQAPIELPSIQLPIALQLDAVHLQQLRLQQPQKPAFEVNALQFSAYTAEHTVHIPALSLRLPNAIVGASGQLTPQQNYPLQFAAHWQFSPPGAAVVHGQSQLQGDLKLLHLRNHSRAPYRSQLTGSIQDLLNLPVLDIQLNTPGITLSKILSQQPPLRVQGQVRFTGPLDNYNIRANLTSQLPQQPALQLNTQAHGNLNEITLDTLHGRSDAGQFNAHGNINWQTALRWQLQATAQNFDPGVVLPAWPGKLNFALNSQGRYAKNVLSGELHLPQLYGQLRDEALSGQADIQFDRNQHTQAQVAIDWGDKNIAVNLNGTPAQHTATLQARTPQLVADLALDGVFNSQQSQWRFQLHRADVTPAERDRWELAQPLNGQLDKTGVNLTRGCWGSGPAKLCGQAEADASGWRASGELQAFPLQWLAAALPELNITGTLDGNISAQSHPQQPLVAQAALQLSAGELRHQAFTQQQQWLPLLTFNGGKLNATWQPDQAGLSLDVDLADGGNVAAKLNLQPQPDILTSPLTGNINATLKDLRLAPVLLPEVAAVDGEINVALTLAGQVNAPQIGGEVGLTANNAVIPALGITVSELRARVQPRGQKFAFALNATSAGTLAIKGQGQFNNNQPRFNARVTGKDFLAAELPVASVTISPDMQLDLRDDHLEFSGTLHVPKAQLRPEALETGAIAISEDQIIVDAPAATQSGLTIGGTLKLVLGDAVHLEGFGLKTRLAGQLTLIEQPGKLARGQGEIYLQDGAYAAFGQELSIEHGRLLFAGGPITRPLLDLRALRKLPDPTLKVGANVRGTPEAPKVTLFSEPALSQTDTLAYLVAGQPLSQADAAQTDLLAKAALALRLRGARFLTEQISSRLGLEDLSLQTDAQTDQAQLVLGKYLSPRLYVSYGIGVFDTSHTLLARYIFSPRWYFEARSDGNVSSGDIFFNVERD